MPKNPERASRGGDVPGTTRTDVDGAVGSPIDVATASFEPGYDEALEETLEAGYISKADLKRGYGSYGVVIGEGRPKDIID